MKQEVVKYFFASRGFFLAKLMLKGDGYNHSSCLADLLVWVMPLV